jgi:hypothetical protein
MSKWDKDGHLSDEVLALLWIVIREFKRVNAPATVKAWDESMKANWSMTGEPADPGPDAQAFSMAASHLMEKSTVLPGLNSSTCVQDWGEFAAFANWAAKQGTAKVEALSKTQKAKTPIPYTVDPVIKADLAYASDWAKPGQPGVNPDQGTPAPAGSWSPWLIGAGVVAALGAAGYAAYRFYPTHSAPRAHANPSDFSPSRYPYKATAKGMSAKWRSYTQYFKDDANARDFLREMILRHGAKSGELYDRRTNTRLETV